MNSEKLSIVISFRNEDQVLEELISRLEKTLLTLSFPYEIIFVDDDSTDKSAEILEAHARRNSSLKILRLSRRFGVQASILAGVHHAGGAAVIMMDADLQDPPELIPSMVTKWKEGNDIVHMVRSRREGESAVKMALTKAAYRCIAMISEIPLTEEAGDFKLLSRKAVEELNRHPERTPYLRGLIASLGFSQTAIQYTREKRHAGVSHFALLGRGPVETFFAAITSFSSFPFYAMLACGALLAALSVIIFTVQLMSAFWGGWNPQAWILNFFFLFLSVNLAALGLLGLYVYSALKQTQQRPLYIIAGKVNFDDASAAKN